MNENFGKFRESAAAAMSGAVSKISEVAKNNMPESSDVTHPSASTWYGRTTSSLTPPLMAMSNACQWARVQP